MNTAINKSMSEDELDRAWVFAQDPAMVEARLFEDGTYGAVISLPGHYTLIWGVIGDTIGFEDRWCYQTQAAALFALETWDYPHQREPEGWYYNPATGRARPNSNDDEEYTAA